jgi:glutaredoxin 3
MKEIKIYTTSFCSYCIRAKRLLQSRGLQYEEISADRDPKLRAWLLEKSGQRTVPQIFIGGISIGGYTELSLLDQRDLLLSMVSDDKADQT